MVVHSPKNFPVASGGGAAAGGAAGDVSGVPASVIAAVTVRKNKGTLPAASLEDVDGISLAGDAVSDVPPTRSGDHPQINPFTPEWFTQLIGATVTAAISANNSAPRQQQQQQPPAVDPCAPRRLNDRKVPDFWEDKPEFWFRLFDSHLSHFNPLEQRCFDALLPLLTPAARATIHLSLIHI